ncbi:D-alanyl-D-alanine carboxypeptidase [Butyrivibrio hungatei DSM 14810]|uniref:D-alanyl-D-alanine carboxypeptidase VanY n=2 Tax=Butyrivibrio hungatei TaxID=185008 RepID=A0A1D9P1X3_9FIRM|nr:M15 family metallopeptidase [Butyrivibrio hungatei]AOZ96502.1 D-alanyl-D-alanine carboxypeptidase VanY [Butyrivibrio hungatei]SHN66028.1 D-alanyl-D-alanine carboxypeptidase [Butyrivibrio hungatei DSM 14810]
MNASSLQLKLSYKEKIVNRVQKFNRKHKALSFLGLAYAVCAITTYNVMFYFYRNIKRFTCLACILLFFVSSSSFSYPAMSLNISFDSGLSAEEYSTDSADVVSDAIDYESDAELAVIGEVDQALIVEAMESDNPDVTEAEHMNPDSQVSLSEILATTAEDDTKIDENQEVPLAASMVATTFSSDDWKIILVNKHHPIPDDYEFPLGTISGTMRCDERIITPLLDMMRAASSDGVSLIICSPYRDMDRQTMLFTNKVGRYMNGGMSYMEAYNLASQAVTVPGSSEHQIGLAIDIISDGYSSLDEGFANTRAGQWLAANSYKYGFILRYPAGKEDITSIEYEPWHFRYVGVDAATVMAENNICLEEFWSTYVE